MSTAIGVVVVVLLALDCASLIQSAQRVEVQRSIKKKLKQGEDAMTDETRKEQEQKDELNDKDLDKASGGLSVHKGSDHDRAENRKENLLVHHQ
jgi:hypothetical protein